jgi:hypothetical protein
MGERLTPAESTELRVAAESAAGMPKLCAFVGRVQKRLVARGLLREASGERLEITEAGRAALHAEEVQDAG